MTGHCGNTGFCDFRTIQMRECGEPAEPGIASGRNYGASRAKWKRPKLVCPSPWALSPLCSPQIESTNTVSHESFFPPILFLCETQIPIAGCHRQWPTIALEVPVWILRVFLSALTGSNLFVAAFCWWEKRIEGFCWNPSEKRQDKGSNKYPTFQIQHASKWLPPCPSECPKQ